VITKDEEPKLFGWGFGVTQLEQNPTCKPNLIEVNHPVEVVSGFNHFFALTKEGHVMGWGQGVSGSLGTNFQEDTDQEEIVPFPQLLESFHEA
jgi:alpha-tubulin suppressor-like RCC1 family protein